MIPLNTYNGDAVLVVGLGKSGLSAAKALTAGGARVSVWDDDASKCEEATSAGFSVADIDTIDFGSINAVVWSPGVPHTHPRRHELADRAKAGGLDLQCDIDVLATVQTDACYIGITGTNGKSTTTALTGHVLQAAGLNAAVGGNLGVPALDLDPLDADGIYVLELSSYQTELTPHLSCSTAVLLNIAPDHLDRHGGMDGYVAAKAKLFENQRDGGTAIIGLDDSHSRGVFTSLKARDDRTVIGISANSAPGAKIVVKDGILVDGLNSDPRDVINLKDIAALPGQHNWQNAAACYAISRTHGVEPDDIVAAFKTFPGLRHRQEVVGTVAGVTFVNDSKATNADAAEKALSCYGCIYWIAGGQQKEGGIETLGPMFARIRQAFLIGEATDTFANDLESAGVTVSRHQSLEDAVVQAGESAIKNAETPATVLLSPACASFDMFDNFEQRGDVFRNTVHTVWPTTATGAQRGHA